MKTKVRTLYTQEVFLAPNEWGAETMISVANAHLDNARSKYYCVTVHEHGGWWLQFTRIEGETICVGSANNLARWSVLVEKYRQFLDRMKVKCLPSIRRGE